MSFKLHGIPFSTCTRRVALIAKERNVPYEVVPVNLQQAEHKNPPHLAHQPFGQIPYITVRRRSSSLCVPLLQYRCGVFSNATLSSKTTASSCSNRAPSVGTSRRSGLDPSWSPPIPRPAQSSSRRRASSMRSSNRLRAASLWKGCSSSSAGWRRTRSASRSWSLNLRLSSTGMRPS